MIDESRIVPYKTSELPEAGGPWLVFAPHADDESFGMGGTLAKATERGIHVEFVVMTDGALGGQQENLTQIRKKEATTAATILGLVSPVFLNNKDRGLSFDRETVAQVVAEIERVKPKAVFFPGVFELHPDHRTTALIVWQALKEKAAGDIVPVAYEVLVQSPINVLVDITTVINRKKAAMAVYESQLNENSYIDIAVTMNKLRTLTLSTDIEFAEGFYRFTPEELKCELSDVIVAKISRYLAVQ